LSQVNAEKIQSNFDLFYKLSQKDEARSELYSFFIETLGDRLALCPYSGREEYGWAQPGGLIEYSLSVLNGLRRENDAHGLGLSVSSMITASLFHAIGKAGDLEDDLFVPEDSQWHQEKLGQFYKYNEKIGKMTVEHRSVWLLNQIGARLSREEYLAILLSAGALSEESKFYLNSQPVLSIALNNAIRMTLALKDR
jgi:hypothetical protein